MFFVAKLLLIHSGFVFIISSFEFSLTNLLIIFFLTLVFFVTLFVTFFLTLVFFVTFLVLWFVYWKTNKKEKTGFLFGLFMIGLWSARFFIEFFRQPDAHIGFVALEWLSMGQLLCLPMIFAGFLLLTYFLRKA